VLYNTNSSQDVYTVQVQYNYCINYAKTQERLYSIKINHFTARNEGSDYSIELPHMRQFK